MEMFENLSPKVSGYQRAECAGGQVSVEVKVVDLLFDDAQTCGLERRACTCGQRIWRRAISFRFRGALSVMAAQ